MEGLGKERRERKRPVLLGGGEDTGLAGTCQDRMPVAYSIGNDVGYVKQKRRPGTWAEQDTGASIQTTLTCRNRQRTRKI